MYEAKNRPSIPDDNVHINAYVKIGHFLCGAASIAVRLLFECEMFLKLKWEGAASIAVQPINGEIRYLLSVLCYGVTLMSRYSRT